MEEREEEEMEAFMLDEKNIAEVIKSREDLSASGVDGISYRIMKGAGAAGVKFMKLLVRASIRSGRVMSTWKEAKTILLHKKGDREDIGNWRPISITNCMYRIFTCLMARAFQKINSKVHIYSDSQKGFIRKTNGCSEHGIILNELLHKANRRRENLVVTAIDFTNAFGSVPHELIMSTMRQRNFPEWTQRVVWNMYEGATSVIETSGSRSRKIAWKRGVKQGCPLSPLLFNLCLEPLLQAISLECADMGTFVGFGENRIEFLVQAYADDVIFISKTANGIKAMLEVLERFVNWSRMEVNAKKCATASYMIDSNYHRSSLAETLKFKNQEIPNLTLAQSLKYLGTAVAPRRRVKLEAIEAKLTEVRVRLQKIMESPLLTVQKIDAVKTFLLPTLDFAMLNGDVGQEQLAMLDRHIRRTIDEALRVRGLPVECHHASWRDGGLSYPSLVDRRRVLMVRSFGQMMMSRDKKVREAMREMSEEERRFRKIGLDEESNFLNWKEEPGEPGTTSLVSRTRETCKKMNIKMKIVDEEMIVGRGESEMKTKTAAGIGHFLTQKIIRMDKIEGLMKHQVHGASYETLKNNEMSNGMLTNIYTRRSNAFFRFVVVGRADCLPTPINLQRWFNDRRDEHCGRCGQEGIPTLAHILNRCTMNYPMMTKRHNGLAAVVRKAIEKFVSRDLRSEIRENEAIREERLSEALRNQRPDIVFERRAENQGRQERQGRQAAEREEEVGREETKMIEIIEFSCPYGYISHGRDSLIKVYEEKKRKYAELANGLKRATGKQVRVTAVIVSSMGAIYGPSMKDLQKVLKCSDRELKKLARKMSETVILGSMEIWRQVTQNIGAGMNEEVNRVIEEEAVLAEEAGAVMEAEAGAEAGRAAGGEAEAEVEAELEARLGDGESEDEEDGGVGVEVEVEIEVGAGRGSAGIGERLRVEGRRGRGKGRGRGRKRERAGIRDEAEIEVRGEVGAEAEAIVEMQAGAGVEAEAELTEETEAEEIEEVMRMRAEVAAEIEAFLVADQRVEVEMEVEAEARDEDEGELRVEAETGEEAGAGAEAENEVGRAENPADDEEWAEGFLV
jgi:hypothetical protein